MHIYNQNKCIRTLKLLRNIFILDIYIYVRGDLLYYHIYIYILVDINDLHIIIHDIYNIYLYIHDISIYI